MSDSPATRADGRPPLRLTPTTSVSEFDALADLFLGPASEPPADTDVPSDLPTDLPTESTSAALDDLELPDAPTSTASDAPAASDRQSAGKPARKPGIEAILLGHMPVLASAWVRQHAAMRARELGGSVALIRLQGGTLTVDLIGDLIGDLSGNLSADRTGTEGFSAQTPATTPAEAMALARRHASEVLIRVDETAEPELFGSRAVDRFTVLSGTDDAAVVGAYRALKAAGPLIDDRPVQVAWLASDEARLAEARQKLDTAVEHFLTVAVEHQQTTQRIDTSIASTIYRGPCTEPVKALLAALATAEPIARAAVEAPPRQAHTSSEQAPTLSARNEPKPRVVPQRSPTAASLIAGLTPINLTCPDATGIDFFTDDAGALHIAAIADMTRAFQSPAEAIEHLLAAKAWATKNSDLLARAVPSLRTAAEPEVHLITDQPKQVRGLLDTAIRLHALVLIGTGTNTQRATIELN